MVDATAIADTGVLDFEAGLIRGAQRGDTAAFETLYRQNVGRVYALCLRMTASVPRAEELTQEIFLRSWERIASFRGESRFSTWLHQLAVNVVLSDIRELKRRPPESPGDLDRIMGQPGASPAQTRALDEAITALPNGARAVFVLHDIEGYRHDEVAAMMGVTEGTCKAQLHRARQLLRKALKP